MGIFTPFVFKKLSSSEIDLYIETAEKLYNKLYKKSILGSVKSYINSIKDSNLKKVYTIEASPEIYYNESEDKIYIPIASCGIWNGFKNGRDREVNDLVNNTTQDMISFLSEEMKKYKIPGEIRVGGGDWDDYEICIAVGPKHIKALIEITEAFSSFARIKFI